MVRVICEAFPDDWELNPPSLTDLENEYRMISHFYRSGMTMTAYSGERPVGLLVSFPDLNPLIKKRADVCSLLAG